MPGSSASFGAKLSCRRRLLRPGSVKSGMSKAISSSKVVRFLIVTRDRYRYGYVVAEAITIARRRTPLGPAQQCWLDVGNGI